MYEVVLRIPPDTGNWLARTLKVKFLLRVCVNTVPNDLCDDNVTA